MDDRFMDFASAMLKDEALQVVLKAEQIRLSTGLHDSVDGDYTLRKTFVVKGTSPESVKSYCQMYDLPFPRPAHSP